MTRVMAVNFSQHGQLHYLLPGETDYRVGDQVLYPTSEGPEVATVVWPPTDVPVRDKEIPVCAGWASESDCERNAFIRMEREEAMDIAVRVIGERELPMKVVAVDVLDRVSEANRLVAVYYLAEERIVFKELVGELARALQAKVDLRQIASRDAARLIGDIGSCGRSLCCTNWLDDLEPVSIRLARVQELQSNPLRISGACGRLLCCLHFENELYQDFFSNTPADGARVTTACGTGRIVGHNVPSGMVKVRLDDGETHVCPAAQLCVVKMESRKPRWKRNREQSEGNVEK